LFYEGISGSAFLPGFGVGSFYAVHYENGKGDSGCQVQQNHIFMRTLNVILHKYYCFDPKGKDIDCQEGLVSEKLSLADELR